MIATGSMSPRFKLGLSLAGNVAAKLPAIGTLVVVLPRLNAAFGPQTYGQILAVIALASMFSFPLNGLNVTARRIIAQSAAQGHTQAEAEGFVSACVVALVLAGGAAIGAAALALTLGYSLPLVSISAALAALAFANAFDSVRAAYNEHFVTATIQLFVQGTILVVLATADLSVVGPIWTALLLGGGMGLSSLIGAALLVRRRRYLLWGSPRRLQELFQGGIFVVGSDGAISLLLNGSVVWIGASAGASAAAWYGTLSRLFQSILAPVLLVLFPLTSYVSSQWPNLSALKRRRAVLVFATGSVLYGLFAAVALTFANHFYVRGFMGLPTWGGGSVAIAVSAAFGGITAYKAYALLSYAVDESRRLSLGATVIVVLAAALAVIGPTPAGTLVVGSLAIASMLSAWVTADAFLRRRILLSQTVHVVKDRSE